MSAIQMRPNIVMIVADDLGYGDLACYGNRYVATPHIDDLANSGVCLHAHYSASSLCAPARASLLTGRYNHRTGAVDVPSNRGLDRIARSEVTIADALKEIGYTTGMVGKWHNGAHDIRYHPNARGFDEFAGFLHGGMDYWRWVLDYNGAQRSADGRYLTDVFTDEAVSFIERHRTEPFFLYVAYNAPHGPLQAPDNLLAKYNRIAGITPAVAAIYAMIEAMDSGIGRILDSLETHGIGDNTFLLFTSDNGPKMGGSGSDSLDRYIGPFSGSKGSSLEGGIRVPAIVRWRDRISANGAPWSIDEMKKADPLVHFTDWYPTLCQIAGAAPWRIGQHQIIERGNPVDGYGVGPAIVDGLSPEPASQKRFWQRNRYRPLGATNAAMRDGRWKLYWPTAPGSESKLPDDTQIFHDGLTKGHRLLSIDKRLPHREISTPVTPRLFDLQNDPGETDDLSDQHPDRIMQMKGEWDDWFDSVYADWKRVWPTI